MKIKGIPPVIISKRYCDVPMARSKGILGHCNYDCRRCFCCIEVDVNGNAEHVDLRRRRKKLDKRGGAEYVRQGYRPDNGYLEK